ncbi:hypothetical protein OC846_005426 [Tilletia horrida]|uniref:Uncharacterized protein n=1 Tax=Tilletia horrida TaxID=155126 RepID=A0AAN6GLB1_9BASI|nr:hypothetical protein OC846_005426 [Tilletia horrida]KAK0567298.1 hypothetical protein OC861_002802 [Tilletia horrida]
MATHQDNSPALTNQTLNGGSEPASSSTVAAAATPASSPPPAPHGAPLDGTSHTQPSPSKAIGRPSVPDTPLNPSTNVNNASMLLGVATGLAIVGILLIFGLIWLAFRLHRHHGPEGRVGLHAGRLHPGGTDSSISSDSRLKHLFAPLRHVSRRATTTSGVGVEAQIHRGGSRAEGMRSGAAIHRMELESEDDIARIIPWIHNKSHSSGIGAHGMENGSDSPYTHSVTRFPMPHELGPEASSEGLYPPWAGYQQHAYNNYSPSHSATSFHTMHPNTPLDHPKSGYFVGGQGVLAGPESMYGAYPSCAPARFMHPLSPHGGSSTASHENFNGATSPHPDDTPAPNPAAVAEVVGNSADEMPSRTLSVRNSVKTSDSDTMVCSPLSLTAKRKIFDPSSESGADDGAHVKDLTSAGGIRPLLSPPHSPGGSSHGHQARYEASCYSMMTLTPPERPATSLGLVPISAAALDYGQPNSFASCYQYGWAPVGPPHTDLSPGVDQTRPLSWDGTSAWTMSTGSAGPDFPQPLHYGYQHCYPQPAMMPPLSMPSGLQPRQAPAGLNLSRRSSQAVGNVRRHPSAAASGKLDHAHGLGGLQEHDAEVPVVRPANDVTAPVQAV